MRAPSRDAHSLHASQWRDICASLSVFFLSVSTPRERIRIRARAMHRIRRRCVVAMARTVLRSRAPALTTRGTDAVADATANASAVVGQQRPRGRSTDARASLDAPDAPDAVRDAPARASYDDSSFPKHMRRRAFVSRMRERVKVNDFEGARAELARLVETHGAPGRAALNVTVHAAAKARDPDAAMSIVESMLRENIAPDVSTHVGVMTAFARSGRRREAFEWLKMYLYGVREDGDGAADGREAMEKYDLTHVIGDMIDGDRRRVSRRGLTIMLFTTVMNAAAMAGDRAMVQEIENMMFEFNIPPGADVLHIMLKLERVAGTSASVEEVWNRLPKKARKLKSHQERVVSHAILGRRNQTHAIESRALALAALKEMYERIGHRRSDEEFEKLAENNFWGSKHARWTGQRGAEEFNKKLQSDEDIVRVGAKEARMATNTVLDTFALIGDIDTVNECFIRMENDLGVNADARTFNAVLRAEYKHEKLTNKSIDLDRALKRFNEILDEMDDREIAPDRHTFTTLLLANAEQGYMIGVAEVLKIMQERDVQLDLTMYNILLSACANAGDLEAALNARASMVNSGVAPGPDTFVPLFMACTKQAAEFDLNDDTDSFADEEALGPLLPLTRSVLDDMELDMLANNVEHNVASYTALIKARGALGQTHVVLELLTQPPEGLELDDVALGVGIMALAKREPTKAIALANTLASDKNVGKPWLLNCVLIAYGYLGQIKAAYERVQDFIDNGGTPNVATYNMLFRAAAQSGGFTEYAPLVMSDMSRRGLAPDAVTRKYLTTVFATASVYDRDMAEELLKQMPGGFNSAHARSDASAHETFEDMDDDIFIAGASYNFDDNFDDIADDDDDDDDIIP